MPSVNKIAQSYAVTPVTPQAKPQVATPRATATTGKDTVTISPAARVLALSVEGMTAEEISQSLQLDIKTVNAYLSIRPKQA